MQITNKLNLPYGLVKAVSPEPHNKPGEISATTLIQGMKQVIENYKKGVLKGDLESMNLLAQECMSGKYVKANLEMGLNLLDAAAKQDYVEAQYNLGNYFYLFWFSKPENDG